MTEYADFRERYGNKQATLDGMVKDISRLQSSVTDYQDRLSTSEEQRTLLQTEVLSQLESIQQLSQKLSTTSKEREHLISRLSSHHSLTTSMLTELVHLKNTLTHTKEKNDALTFENEQLKMTLGSDLNELTPRPRWGVLQGEFRSLATIDGRSRYSSQRKPQPTKMLGSCSRT